MPADYPCFAQYEKLPSGIGNIIHVIIPIVYDFSITENIRLYQVINLVNNPHTRISVIIGNLTSFLDNLVNFVIAMWN